ncbi:paeninodin family lasso peptide [Halalkalibacter alkalisediminis]|uniref:Paeninodin family lasso peptide n=1 Tax=Halalkalibacter alkalisediminis TaxID=935616 RepID=A0ABV6NH35_9BACI|nr:paeninodin family lasso peptide [Halalkalibacter alkalisediminis]
MKQTWKKPVLEELKVNMTMASTVNGPYTDEAYVPGERVDASAPAYNRFTS